MQNVGVHQFSRFTKDIHFLRPPLSESDNSNSSDLLVQLLTIELYQPNRNGLLKNVQREKSYYHLRNNVAPVMLFGVNQKGNSVCIQVSNFRPHIYVQVPQHWNELHVEQFIALLAAATGREDEMFAEFMPNSYTPSFGFFNNDKFNFVKLEFLSDDCRRSVTSRLWKPFTDAALGLDNVIMIPLEYQVNWQLQFFEAANLQTSGWCLLKAGTYQILDQDVAYSLTQINVACEFTSLQPYESIQIAPMLIASFDIESYRGSNDGKYGDPDVDGDSVIQIGVVVQFYGQPDFCYSVVFCLRSVDKTDCTEFEIYDFQTEKEMIENFQYFWRCLGPDVAVGYNIFQYDFHYLFTRAVKVQAVKFFEIGRLKGVESKLEDSTLESKAYASNKWKIMAMPGIELIDMYTIIKREHKKKIKKQFKLGMVANDLLGLDKVDLPYSKVQKYQNRTPQKRRRIAHYCWWDCVLPLKLIFNGKIKAIESLVEMSRTTFVPINYLVMRGQGIKSFSQFVRKAHKEGYVVFEPPDHKLKADDMRRAEAEQKKYEVWAKNAGVKIKKAKQEKSYSGATVIEPDAGFYNRPIPTLDFASLYPSIMIGENLCYTTLVIKSEYLNLPGVEYESYNLPAHGSVNAHTNIFVKNKPGILPRILTELLAARSVAKKRLAEATTESDKVIYNHRQLCIKLCANSLYGFTGAQVGKLPCPEIAETVTFCGRRMLFTTKNYLETKYKSWGTKVIYGDTDSVMIDYNMPGEDAFVRIFDQARMDAADISKLFKPPSKLEFEKVYYPMLLPPLKKNYGAQLWLNPGNPEYLDLKGFKCVKSDTCELVKKISLKILTMMIEGRNLIGSVHYLLKCLEKIHNNYYPRDMYTITMMCSRSIDQYDSAPPHIELARRMRERDPNNAPKSGDRIAYVALDIGDINLKAPVGSVIEDAAYAAERNLPIDRLWYIRRQLQEPICTIYSVCFDNPKEIFDRAAAKQIKIQSNIVDFFQSKKAVLPEVSLPSWLIPYKKKIKNELVQRSLSDLMGKKKNVEPSPTEVTLQPRIIAPKLAPKRVAYSAKQTPVSSFFKKKQ